MMRRSLLIGGIALSVAVPMSFVAHPAFATASDTAVAGALVTTTLDNLGLTNLSPELENALTKDMSAALDAGVVDPALVGAVTGVLENPDMLKGLTDVFAAHLKQQVEAWTPSSSDETTNSRPTTRPKSGSTTGDEDSSGGDGVSGGGNPGSNGSSGSNGTSGSNGKTNSNNSGTSGNSGNSGNSNSTDDSGESGNSGNKGNSGSSGNGNGNSSNGNAGNSSKPGRGSDDSSDEVSDDSFTPFVPGRQP